MVNLMFHVENIKIQQFVMKQNLRDLSKLIKNVEFEYGDYRKSGKYIDKNTFFYFDPPYRPLSITSGFTSYTKEDFNDDNQKDLAKYLKN